MVIDRAVAQRYGLNVNEIDTFLNNAFSQRQIATQYQMLNQYYSIIGLNNNYIQNPEVLKQLYVLTSNNQSIPISAFAHLKIYHCTIIGCPSKSDGNDHDCFNLANGQTGKKVHPGIGLGNSLNSDLGHWCRG